MKKILLVALAVTAAVCLVGCFGGHMPIFQKLFPFFR